MAKYAIDLYGESYYGRDVFVTYSVGDVSAVQTGYGSITLHWTTPTDVENWGVLRIVRSTSGFPAHEQDGQAILEITPDAPQNSFTDSGLTGGRFYYYSIFLSSDFPDYSASDVYQSGDTVSYAGSRWLCLADNTTGIAPAVGAAQWQATNSTALWNRAGEASSLAVADYGYRDRLYSLMPTPYATAQEEVSAPQDPSNEVFWRYLSVLAWSLDMARTELADQEHLHRVETMPLSRMDLLAHQLGLTPEASVSPRLRRLRVGRASQIAKRKGTIEAIKEVIYDLTGYDSDITLSGNALLDADQAESYYPRFPQWDPSITYAQGAVVSYGSYLYAASSNTVRLEAESLTLALNGAPSSVVQGNTPTTKYSGDAQVLFRTNAVNQGGTFTFSIPSTGTYDLAIGMTRSYDYGIVSFQLDGVTVTTGSGGNLTFDGFSYSTSPATSVYLGRYTLASGSHTVKVTVTSKNSKSGTAFKSVNNGYQMGVDYLTYTPQGSSSGMGVAPTGLATSNAFWTHYTGQISHALDNSLTGGISTWEQVSFTGGANASPSNLAVYSGYLALSGTGDNRANLAVMTNGTGTTATLSAHSIPRAKVAAWNSSTSYRRGAYVSYNGVNYLAILPTQGDTPDVDRTHWRPETISTTGADRYLVSAYGIHLPQGRAWSGGARYEAGDRVQYQGEAYRASVAHAGVPPTGAPTDNTAWAWEGSAQPAFTASAWTSRYSGSGTPSRSIYIEWYDAKGNLITTINPSTVGTNPDLFVPFSRNSANLQTDPGTTTDIGGLTWSKTSTDTPVASSGMAYWSTRASNQNAQGRHLYLAYDRADNINIGITFLTTPPAGIEHGIAFRRTDSNNCWSVSRTRLAKIVTGTVTAVASWTTLLDGARVYVTLVGSTIKVFQYQGAGLAPIQLASITDAFNSTATGIGIFERNY